MPQTSPYLAGVTQLRTTTPIPGLKKKKWMHKALAIPFAFTIVFVFVIKKREILQISNRNNKENLEESKTRAPLLLSTKKNSPTKRRSDSIDWIEQVKEPRCLCKRHAYACASHNRKHEIDCNWSTKNFVDKRATNQLANQIHGRC